MRPPLRRALSLVPSNAVTGIGSLPHTQPEHALQMSLQLDVPFLPQLPSGNPVERMIAAALEGLPGMTYDADGLCTVDLAIWQTSRAGLEAQLESALGGNALEAFEPSAASCRSYRPFLGEVARRRLPLAKVQLAGPCTVRWVTKVSGGGAAADVRDLDPPLFRWVMARSLAMAHAVRRTGATPLFFLDEPGLCALDTRDPRHLLALQELKLLVAVLQGAGALVGVHCCGNTEWAALLDLGLDLLSFDVRLSLDAVLDERAALGRFLSTGAVLSLGIVPTDLASTYAVDELVDSVEAGVRASAPPGFPVEGFLSRLPLTPACGLAMRSVLDAERIVGEVRAAQLRFHALEAA